MKKIYAPLLILFFIIISGCGHSQSQVRKNPDKLLEYNFSYDDISKINKKLSKQKYSYSTKTNKNIISIISLDNGKAYVKEYIINDNEVKDIEISKKDFIISLHANSTILYTWNIKNSSHLKTDEIFELKSKKTIGIPFSTDADGENYNRENFLFEVKKEGTQKIVLRYEHCENAEKLKDDYNEITFNLKVCNEEDK
ncbi:protease inhibitor I42 family protein [Oceanirhabdus sp. W0125-5]|uniref:protease inhibitor I42 family protein n=1 Tax=Oceanirhabdus sp. W0125-5 TaxID=2999116 RepID=UPI0022F2E50E|nr:protease inhibitor I42 family protein [Oceanirhabdus sp. W0125-5]WBW96169.1 protease inhibitor I42 family protein [Oceanirhabdus sp. W0125-5]